MNEPIKTGDDCEVIDGMGEGKSPNIGLKVKVVSLQCEHSRHGRIWRCSGDGVQQLSETGSYIVAGWADFANSWLRKLPPVKPKEKSKERDTELVS